MAFYGYTVDLDQYYHNDPYNDHYFSSIPIQESSQYTVPPPESNYYEYYHSDSEHIHYQSSYNHYEYYSVTESPDIQAPLYFPSEPIFRISYSTVELDDTEFDDYDPTPYGGGYDQATAYGKPIPPSDITCYPRSGPKSDGVLSEKISYASIPSPYGKDDQDQPNKPQSGIKLNGKDDQDHPIKPPSGTKPIVENVENGDKVKVDTSGDAEQFEIEDKGNGSDEREKGTNGDYGYEGERTQVAQIPYGSGLEAMDICESLFGYWPCLAKKAEQERRKCCDQERKTDPWGSAADYLFGSPLVYNDYGNYHQQDQNYECWGNS